MQPMHLAIGLIEGLATAALILFVRRARPELFNQAPGKSVDISKPAAFPARLLAAFGLLALLGAGVFSWFSSIQPNALEWSIARATGHPDLQATESALHTQLAAWQKKLALFPEYRLTLTAQAGTGTAPPQAVTATTTEIRPTLDAGTSLAGIVGGIATLALAMAIGRLLRHLRKNSTVQSDL